MKARGQSILELAVLGAILVGILGLVVSYGLRYNYQQKAMMQAFRLAYNNSPEGGSYTLVVDKHLPNPSDPWGVGSVIPISSSASITRNYHLQDIAACDAEDASACSTEDLPKTTIEIKGTNGSFIRSFTTAGFRDVYLNLDRAGLDRYKEIYGASNICLEPGYGCGYREGGWGKKIRILDPCEGELVNADMVRRICYLMSDSTACVNDCLRGDNNPERCRGVCNASVELPWYCKAEAALFPPDKFPTGGSMGIGVNSSQTANINNRLTRSGTSTTDNLDWNVQTNRKIFYKSGQGLAEIDVPTEVSQRENWNWQ